MYQIKMERRSGADDPVVIWLTSLTPIRWGGRERAMKFESKGDARRTAAGIKLAGAWSIEPVSN